MNVWDISIDVEISLTSIGRKKDVQTVSINDICKVHVFEDAKRKGLEVKKRPVRTKFIGDVQEPAPSSGVDRASHKMAASQRLCRVEELGS